MIQADKPAIWNDEVGAMLDDIIAYLNDDGLEAEQQAADCTNEYVGMRTLLLSTTSKGVTSPAHRLKDKGSLLRIIFEYVVPSVVPPEALRLAERSIIRRPSLVAQPSSLAAATHRRHTTAAGATALSLLLTRTL
jgi:hypothetical protein